MESDDIDGAMTMKHSAESMLLDALMSQNQDAALEALRGDASLRGRVENTAERNKRLALAAAEQETNGVTGKAARNAALYANPDLGEAFSGMSDDAIRKALSRGRKHLD